MKIIQAKPFHKPQTEFQRFLPEGPTQLLNTDGSRSTILAWVSIQHSPSFTDGSLNLLDLSTGENKNYPLEGRPGFLAQSKVENKIYIGLENRIVLYDLAEHLITWEGPKISPSDHTAINDGTVFSDGLIFGTKDCRFEEDIAHLYFYNTRTASLQTLLGGQTCSNGKVVLPGENENQRILYDIDTPSKTLVSYKFDLREMTLGDRKLVLDLRHREDLPDGMKICPGNESVVIAFYNPNDRPYGLAHQFNLASGEIECEWQLANSPRVTCPEFVEIDGGVKLLFTTADEGLTKEQQKMHREAGTLFLAESGFSEMPSQRHLVEIPSIL